MDPLEVDDDRRDEQWSEASETSLLTPAEKYQVWLEVVTGQGSQREIADKWGVDRSTVTLIVKTAKQGALDRAGSLEAGSGGQDI